MLFAGCVDVLGEPDTQLVEKNTEGTGCHKSESWQCSHCHVERACHLCQHLSRCLSPR